VTKVKKSRGRGTEEKLFLSDLLGLILENRRLVLAAIATVADWLD
jgi:hypothetical protein